MFEHSIKVPRLYKEAAQKLKMAYEAGVSLRMEQYHIKHKNVKAVFALVVESFKNFATIDTLIQKAGILEKEPRLDPWLTRVLITEMLWKDRSLQGECKPIKTLLLYADQLRLLKNEILENQINESKGITTLNKPRFVRVNTLKTTLTEVMETFQDEEWVFKSNKNLHDGTYEDFISKISALKYYEFMVDVHIKDLLIFPPQTKFHYHSFYQDNLIMLQDKSSCLPVHLLNPQPKSVVLDMCAAPGMKTSYLAALLNNKGTIYAVEKDEKRFNILNETLEGAGVTCVKTFNRDALKITNEDCPDVEYILVDPSCSGSGMTSRIKMLNEKKPDDNRLGSLSRFQITVLKHALGHFPKAKRVVYSTCSLYPQENEQVVEEVLQLGHNFKLINANDLLKIKIESTKPHGKKGSIKDKCLYFTPDKDLTNGFFIAVFERCEDSLIQFKENYKKKRNYETESFDEYSSKKKKYKNTTENLEANLLDYKKEEKYEETNKYNNIAEKKKKQNKIENIDNNPISDNSNEENKSPSSDPIKQEEIFIKKKKRYEESEELIEYDKLKRKKKQRKMESIEIIAQNTMENELPHHSNDYEQIVKTKKVKNKICAKNVEHIKYENIPTKKKPLQNEIMVCDDSVDLQSFVENATKKKDKKKKKKREKSKTNYEHEEYNSQESQENNINVIEPKSEDVSSQYAPKGNDDLQPFVENTTKKKKNKKKKLERRSERNYKHEECVTEESKRININIIELHSEENGI